MPGSRFLRPAGARGALRPLVLLGGLVLVGLGVIVTGKAAATPLDPQGEDWEGLSQLVQMARSELGAARVVVASTLDLGSLVRGDALLLVHPERPVDAEELAVFMRAGGRVVLLDDYGAGDSLMTHFGIRRVPLPQRPAEMLRGNPSFAIAEPASVHPAVRDVSHVVTNHGVGLEHPGLSPVLVVHGDGEPDALLSVAGAVGEGRLLAVGDASILMNAMLRYPGNRALGISLVRYATDDDASGKRGGKLYVLANEFRTTGSFGADSRVGGAISDVRRAFVDGMEMLRRDGMPPMAAYIASLALGLGIVVWTGARAGKTHRPTTPRFAREVPVVEQGGIAGHAATVGAPGTSRVLAMLELKSALEEDLTLRLGLDRTPSHDVLAAKVRASGWLDEEKAESLARLLATLARIEGGLVGRRRSGFERLRDVDVVGVATQIRELLALIASAAAARRA